MAPKKENKRNQLLPGQESIVSFFGPRATQPAASGASNANSTSAQSAQPSHQRDPAESLRLSRQANVHRGGADAVVSAPVLPRLSETAARLNQQLQGAVHRYHYSRAARQAAGEADVPHNQQQQQEQQQQQQQYEAALRAAYVQVECFRKLNRQQLLAARSDHLQPLLIIAGPGTGKTSTLICRILHLLSQGVQPEQVLVITFTNKAADELQARLATAIGEARAIAAAAEGASSTLQPVRIGVLACTFHSYCYRLLRQYYRAVGFSQCPVVWLEKDARAAVRLAIKLADVDRVRLQLERWLGCSEGWAAVQRAAAQKHPELMRKWFAEVHDARRKAEQAAATQKQRKEAAEAKKRKANEPQQRTRKQNGRQPPPLSKGQQQLHFNGRPGKVPRWDGAQDVFSSGASAAQHEEPGQEALQQQHQQQQQQQGLQPTHQPQEQPDHAHMLPPSAVYVQQPHTQQGWQQQQGLDQQHGWQQQQHQEQSNQLQQQQQQQHQQQQGQQQGSQQQQQPQQPGNQHGLNLGQQQDGAIPASEQLGGLVQQELQLQAKIRLFAFLLEEYRHTGSDEAQQGLPSAEQLQGKISVKLVKYTQKLLDGFKCKGERPEAGREAGVYQYYQMLLQKCNAVDFNDLLGHVVDMLQHHPSILQHVCRMWQYLLVDEYQDCNMQQVDIVRLLQDVLQRVTAVGDDAQSIYRFRGAAPNVFPLYKAAFAHADLVRTLEANYRSTPQILQVAKAVLTNSGLHPKDLIPQNSGEGKPPVKLLIVDTEEHEAAVIAQEAKRLHAEEQVPYGDMAVLFRAFRWSNGRAHTKLQKALTREGVQFVLVRDTSLFERVEVQDLLAYINLARDPDNDAAFMRVLNVPPRRLGKKFEQQLRDEQERLMAEYADQQQQQGQFEHGLQQEQQRVERPSFHAIARQLLERHEVATLHEKKLREFLAVLQELYDDVRGQTPAEAVLTVLQRVPGFKDHIEKQKQKKRKQNEGENAPAIEAEEDDEEDREEEDEQAGSQAAEEQQRHTEHRQGSGRGRGRGSNIRSRQQERQQQPGSRGAAAAAAAAAGGAPQFMSARRAFEQQQPSEDQYSSMSDSHATADDSMATGATTAVDSDSGSEDESDEESDAAGDDDEPAVGSDERPSELVTPALALYDEALAFGTKWAAEHGTATAASAAAAGAGISSTSPVADTQPASGGDSNTAQGEGSAVFPSLYALMSQHVVVQWTSRQLLASGLPDILLEDLYATVGKGSRPLADFTAHIALNPNREGGKHSKACNKQQQQEAPAQSPDALVISTIHAAKGLEYNTVWVPRWVQGFLPTMPRKADLERLESMEEIQEFELEHVREEQRLAHVAVTRPKERLYLTRPLYVRTPKRNAQGQLEDERNVLVDSQFLGYLEHLQQNSAVYKVVDLSTGL